MAETCLYPSFLRSMRSLTYGMVAYVLFLEAFVSVAQYVLMPELLRSGAGWGLFLMPCLYAVTFYRLILPRRMMAILQEYMQAKHPETLNDRVLASNLKALCIICVYERYRFGIFSPRTLARVMQVRLLEVEARYLSCREILMAEIG